MKHMSSNISVKNVQPYTGTKEETSAANKAPAASSVPNRITSTGDIKEALRKGEDISVSDEQLIKAIEKANKALEGRTTTLNISVHEKTKQIMVKVLDRETGEIIREVPPEKTLDFIAKVWEMAGLLVDERT